MFIKKYGLCTKEIYLNNEMLGTALPIGVSRLV